MIIYIVSVTCNKFLYMHMTIALKSLNEMQQQPVYVSRLNNMIVQFCALLTLKCITN